MSDHDRELLRGEIAKGRAVLTRLADYLHGFVRERLEGMGRNVDSALIVAGALENYYTAVETIFVRISGYFENSLPPDRWHAELLHRMTVVVPGVRPAIISDRTMGRLGELMRFRHFMRYYYALDYEWVRLDALLALFDELHPALLEELGRFGQALEADG